MYKQKQWDRYCSLRDKQRQTFEKDKDVSPVMLFWLNKGRLFVRALIGFLITKN